MLGEPVSGDNLLVGAARDGSTGLFGTGTAFNGTMRSSHAGSGEGGSLLTNSSFSNYSATGSPKFVGWTETAGGANIAQDTSNFYRGHPPGGTATERSLQMTAGATITLRQPISSINGGALDPNTPYLLRMMVNKTVGGATDGTVSISIGSQSASSTVAALGANWVEVVLTLGQNSWFKNFNQDDLYVEIQWTGSTGSNTLLIDDVLLVPLVQVDGTWWNIRHNAGTPASWIIDDTLTITDSGGAAGTGKLQYWLWRAGLRSLPNSGTTQVTDP